MHLKDSMEGLSMTYQQLIAKCKSQKASLHAYKEHLISYNWREEKAECHILNLTMRVADAKEPRTRN